MKDKQITDDEHKKITEVENLPKDDMEYIERLMKKDIFVMDLEELKDYLDHIIQGRINTEMNPVIQDIFAHIQIYFRIIDLQTNLIMARANAGYSLAYALGLFIKDRFPDDYEVIFHIMDEKQKELDMRCVKGLPIKSQEEIMKKAKLMFRQKQQPKVD